MKLLHAACALALLAAAPVSAQTMSTLLPSLDWPDDGVTSSTKTCETDGTSPCTVQE